MIFLSEVQYKDLLDFACKRASAHVNCMRGPYYALYKKLFDDAYKMGCTFLAAEKVNTPTYYENDICIIYKCEINSIDIPENSKFVGLCFDLTDIDSIYRHLLLEKDGEILLPNKYIYAGIIIEKDGKLYSPDRVKYYFNYSGDMHQLLGAVRKDLMFCKYCNHRTEKLYINDFVNNTYNYCFISCKDCSNTIHKKQIAESVNDKLGIIL